MKPKPFRECGNRFRRENQSAKSKQINQIGPNGMVRVQEIKIGEGNMKTNRTIICAFAWLAVAAAMLCGSTAQAQARWKFQFTAGIADLTEIGYPDPIYDPEGGCYEIRSKWFCRKMFV